MKGFKCQLHFHRFWVLLLALFLPVFSCIFTLRDASAVSPTGTDQYSITPSTSGFGHVTNYVDYTWNNDYPLTQSGNDYWVNVPFAAWANINLMSLRLNKPIPANSLVSLKVVWTVDSVAYNSLVKYDGLQFEHNRSYLYDSCINAYGQVQSISGKKLTLTCNYLFYNSSETAIIDSIYGSHIWEIVFQSDVADHINIVISQPTSISLTNDGLSASDRAWLEEVLADSSTDVSSVVSKLNEVKAEQQATTRAVEAQTRQQHEDYENEVDREEAKEEELNDQKDDLSISAQNPGNPFANLFNVTGCVSLPVFSQWFHQDHVTQVCSPYPEQTRPVIEFVSSVIVIGLLIRIYFKNFKGGYAS